VRDIGTSDRRGASARLPLPSGSPTAPAADGGSARTLRGMRDRRQVRWPAWLAAGLAFASAGVSAYWTLGGDRLLDTVGGEIERLARERSAGALALGATTVLLKVLAGALAVGLAQLDVGGTRRRLLLWANGLAGAVLCLWGAANVVVGALVLGGAIEPAADVDRRAIRWHVFVWDMWFLVWGVALAVAVAAARRDRSPRGEVRSRGRIARARQPPPGAAG